MMQFVAGPSLLTNVPTIVEVLHDHAAELGHDFIAYRNHAYRVVNLCAAIVKDRVELEKIADHHKITPSHANHDSLVEPFRRGDWIDVTRWWRNSKLSHRDMLLGPSQHEGTARQLTDNDQAASSSFAARL